MAPLRVITSCYKDDDKLLWTIDLVKRGIPYIIYKKIDNEMTISTKFEDLPHQLLKMPNIGRCEYTFLKHIILNYDNLDDITVFTKSNWAENGISFWEFINTCKEYDYMIVGTHASEVDYSTDDIKNYNGDIIDSRTTWYNEVFKDSTESRPTMVTAWGHGPCFSVSRELIRRHPKGVYEYLLDRISIPSQNYNKEDAINIGKIYHDEIQRFYTILFTHDLIEGKFKIYPNSNIVIDQDDAIKRYIVLRYDKEDRVVLCHLVDGCLVVKSLLPK